ncbi:Uncharacterised protein [Bordetella pertussis]|nr:Uncharacterised protein [Bordetella pertussis]
MHARKVDVAHVVGAVVVADLPAGPVVAFDAELVARIEPFDHGNIRVPAVVGLGRLVFRRLVEFDMKCGLCHGLVSWWSPADGRGRRVHRGRFPAMLGTRRAGHSLCARELQIA